MRIGTLVGVSFAVATSVADVARAAPAVLERFAGDWEVQVSVTRPRKVFTRYFESAVLAPGGKLLRTSTSVKADGTQDWSMMAFDRAANGYALWIFSSSGATFYLAPGKWDEATRSIVWKAPAASPVSHQTRCAFTDERTRTCDTLVKDWKGGVLLEQSYTAVRR